METTQKSPSTTTKEAIDSLKKRLSELKNQFGTRMDYAQKSVEIAKRDYGIEISRSNVYSTLNGFYKKPNPRVIRAIKTALDEITKEYEALADILK